MGRIPAHDTTEKGRFCRKLSIWGEGGGYNHRLKSPKINTVWTSSADSPPPSQIAIFFRIVHCGLRLPSPSNIMSTCGVWGAGGDLTHRARAGSHIRTRAHADSRTAVTQLLQGQCVHSAGGVPKSARGALRGPPRSSSLLRAHGAQPAHAAPCSPCSLSLPEECPCGSRLQGFG